MKPSIKDRLIKRLIARLPVESRWRRKLLQYYWRSHDMPVFMLPSLIDALDKLRPALRFIQIGSNDVSYGDPLSFHMLHSGWSGILVEPVPHVFRRLQDKLGGRPEMILENLAIAEQSGHFPFYHLAPDANPDLPPLVRPTGVIHA